MEGREHRGLRAAAQQARDSVRRSRWASCCSRISSCPTCLLTSAAKRTQRTSEILAKLLALPLRRVKMAEQLYLARAEVILTLAQSTGPKVRHLAIVGHNPGISELAALAGSGRHWRSGSSTTASACTLTFVSDSWADIAAPAARAVRARRPQSLFNLF